MQFREIASLAHTLFGVREALVDGAQPIVRYVQPKRSRIGQDTRETRAADETGANRALHGKAVESAVRCLRRGVRARRVRAPGTSGSIRASVAGPYSRQSANDLVADRPALGRLAADQVNALRNEQREHEA